ncbi:MAG: carboxypeptidase regulatory-like domain-containing protein [Nitrospirae bacterium]|nr:carboxypeptidase regulatory-like domain-containing protein [Nitrospirota bacterium]
MQRFIKIFSCLSIAITCLWASPSQGQIINGDLSTGLDGWETNGNVSVEEEAAILRTGGMNGEWDTSLSTSFIVAGDSLTFRYYFDVIGYDDIIYGVYPSFPFDSFQVSVDTGGEDYPLVESLAWEPAGYFIPFSMDISSITPGTSAILSFILLDEDDGFRAVAAIDGLSDPVKPIPEPGTLLLLGGGLIGLFISGRYRAEVGRSFLCLSIGCVVLISFNGIAYSEWIETNVDDRVQLEFTAPMFNTRSNILTLDMTAANISEASLFTPLKIMITGISTPYVTVTNPDGYTSEGIPFFDLTPGITDAVLSPGEKTPVKKISFYNPKRVKFRWDQDVVAFIDVAVEKGPVIYNLCLVPGEFPSVCEFYGDDLDVENSEFSRLQHNPLPEMYRYQQVRVYTFDNEDLPIRVTINGREAVYNEEMGYYYTTMVLDNGLNPISILVINDSGLTAGRELSLNIDSVPPHIDILNLTGGEMVTMPDQEIRGTVDDPDVTHVILIKDFLSVEDVPVYNGTFSRDVTLSLGHNNISIAATDMAGNSAYYHLDIVCAYSEDGEITGHIYNSILGLPVAGAVVTAISGSDYAAGTVVSDEAGNYRFEGVESGDVTLLIAKDGYEPVRLEVFSPGGTAPYVQNVPLTPISSPDTWTLIGQVRDTGGLPLPEVRISIAGTLFAVSSDLNGIYIIPGMPRESFTVEVSHGGYEGASLTINSRMYSDTTMILTHDFILREMISFIDIISPADGEFVSGENLLVVGSVRSGGRDEGVRVNDIPAQVYNGYFMANDVPLVEGVNRITAEMVDPSGTLQTDSVDVTLSQRDKTAVTLYTQEAGMVPAEISVRIEASPGIVFAEHGLEVVGPGTAEWLSEGPLQYRVFINEPGIYTLGFWGIDPMGNRYEDTFGFTGIARGDVEEILKALWTKFKNDLIANNIEAALSIFTPETRGRYAEQFFLLGESLPDIFTNIGDIQIISLKDNLAKTRVYEGEITHYVWFARDIYGQWKIHKF